MKKCRKCGQFIKKRYKKGEPIHCHWTYEATGIVIGHSDIVLLGIDPSNHDWWLTTGRKPHERRIP